MRPLRRQITGITELKLVHPNDQESILRTLNQHKVYSQIATPLWMPLVPFLRIILTDSLTQLEELTDD